MLPDSSPLRSAVRPPLALLVDRDRDTRLMYAEYLKLTCEIEQAEDGREALAKAIARRPDVIISETRLPGISGLELCNLLRADTSTCGIPIVFVTGDGLENDLRRAKAAGADSVFLKPCLPQTLLAEIRRLLEQSGDVNNQQRPISETVNEHPARASPGIERPPMAPRRATLSRAHHRGYTTEPPIAPPALVCPSCDQLLAYQRSHIGGVSVRLSEQWDYYECAAGCGCFQYRQRTKKLRRVT